MVHWLLVCPAVTFSLICMIHVCVCVSTSHSDFMSLTVVFLGIQGFTVVCVSVLHGYVLGNFV